MNVSEIFKYTKYFLYMYIFIIYFIYINCIGNISTYQEYLFFRIVSMNGCVLLKFLQFVKSNETVLMKFQKINFNKILNSEIFKNVYEDNYLHSFKYTSRIYKKDFRQSIQKQYDIDFSNIKSGSIAQVYKAFDKVNNRFVAIKVLHPDLKYQHYVATKLIDIIIWFTNFHIFNKYKLIISPKIFSDFIINEFNLNYEYKNQLYMRNLYKNNKYIKIPKPYKSSSNILIMEYIENSKSFKELDICNHKIYKIINNLFIILLKYNICISDYTHLDLHTKNWKIIRTNSNKLKYKIVIFDFGRIVKNDFKHIIYNMDLNFYCKKLDKCFEEFKHFIINNKLFNLEHCKEFYSTHKNTYKTNFETFGNFYIRLICYVNENNFIFPETVLLIILSLCYSYEEWNSLTNLENLKSDYEYHQAVINTYKKFMLIIRKYNVFQELEDSYKTVLDSNTLSEISFDQKQFEIKQNNSNFYSVKI